METSEVPKACLVTALYPKTFPDLYPMSHREESHKGPGRTTTHLGWPIRSICTHLVPRSHTKCSVLTHKGSLAQRLALPPLRDLAGSSASDE